MYVPLPLNTTCTGVVFAADAGGSADNAIKPATADTTAVSLRAKAGTPTSNNRRPELPSSGPPVCGILPARARVDLAADRDHRSYPRAVYGTVKWMRQSEPDRVRQRNVGGILLVGGSADHDRDRDTHLTGERETRRRPTARDRGLRWGNPRVSQI